jgi:hypothetical protein
VELWTEVEDPKLVPKCVYHQLAMHIFCRQIKELATTTKLDFDFKVKLGHHTVSLLLLSHA